VGIPQGLEPLNAATRNDLMEIMDDRYEQSATVIISQLPTEQWYESGVMKILNLRN